MKLIISLIICILSILNVSVVSSTDVAFGIWNKDSESAAVGLINLSSSQVQEKYEMNGYQIVNNISSAFNPVTSQLQFIVKSKFETDGEETQFLAIVDVLNWDSAFGYFGEFNTSINFTSLQSDCTTNDDSLWVTYTMFEEYPSEFFIGKIHIKENQLETITSIKGTFSSSYYSTITNQLIVSWYNNTNVTYVGSFDQFGESVSIDKYSLSNMNSVGKYSVQNAPVPYNLFFIPSESKPTVLGNINMKNGNSKIFYSQLFLLDTNTNSFMNLLFTKPNIGINSCMVSSGLPNSNDFSLYAVYSNSRSQTGFNIVKFNLLNIEEPIESIKPISFNVLGMWMTTYKPNVRH